MPDPIIKYQIYNKEGKSAFVDGALFDKNVNGFAEKYKDATIRMVDPNGNSRNVPISMYEEAKRRGGRAYTANFVKKQNAVQTEPAQQESPAASPQSPVQQSAQQPAVQPVNTASVAQPAPQQEVVQPVDSPAVAQPVSIDSANAQRVDTASRMAPAVQAPSVQAPTVESQKEFVGPLHSNQPFGTVSGRNAIAEAQKNMDVRKIIREDAEKGFEGFYQKNVAGSFQSEKAAAEERSRSKTIEPALQSVYSPFQNWSVNTRNAVVEARETNPEKVANTVLNHIDESALSDYVLRRMGIDPSMSQEEQTEVSQGDSAKIKDATAEMRDKVLGELQQRMYDEYKAAKAPKSVLEYIISSAMKNNLSTKLLTAIINRAAGNKGVLQQLEGQALQEFGEKQSVFARGAAAAGSIMMDAPWFKGVGMVGNAARAGITNLFAGGGKMVMNAIGNRSLGTISDVAAKRWASMNPFVNVAAGSIGSGITFGLYDTAGEAINEFQNGELSLNGLASAFGHGFFTGSAVGMLGGTISAATRNASKAKKLVADVGGFAGETALFTGLEGYEQMKEKHIGVADVDWASIAGKNAAMLGVLKLQSIPQIRERYKSTGDILTKDDKEALKAQGIDPEKWFGLDMLSKLSEEGSYNAQKVGLPTANMRAAEGGAFREFLANENIPINTRRRVSYLMCGVATPEPRAYGMESGQDENGFFINTYTDNGKLIDRKTFKNQSDFNNAFENVSGQVQLNTIDALRAMSRNKAPFFNESLLSVAEEAGIELTEISEAVRRVRDGKATQADKKIVERVNELMEQKANANGDDVENRAANAVLNSTGVDVTKALAKKNSQRTPLEKQAVSEYMQRLQEELGLNGESSSEAVNENVIPGPGVTPEGADNVQNFGENVQNPAENVQKRLENVQNQPEGAVEPTPGGSSDPELTLRECAKAEYQSGNREGVRDTALRYRLSKENLAAAGYTGDYSDLDEIASDPTTPAELKQAAIEYMDAHDAIGGYYDAIDEQVAQNVEKYKATMEPLVDQNTGMITFGTDTTGKRVYVTSSRSRAGMVWVADENGENRRMMYLKDIKDMTARDPEEIYAEFQQQAEQQAKAELDGITSASMNVGDKVSLSLDDPESTGTIVAVNPDGTMLVKDNLGRTVTATSEQLADIQDKVGMRDILQKEQFKQERQQRQDSIEETLKGVGIVPGKPITLAQEEEGGTFSPYKAVVDGFENGMVKMHLFGEGPMYFFQMEPEELMNQFNKNNELEEAERVQAEETRKAEERARAEAEAAAEAQREAERQAELQKVAKNRLAKTDDGKPDFERSKPEDVAAYIREEIGLDNADRTIANTMAPIQMEIQDFEDAIKNGKLGIAEAADASTRLKWAKERLDFWNNVRGLVDVMKSQEKAVDLTKEKKVAPNEKKYKPLEDAKVQYSDVPEAIEALGDLQPRTLEEVAAEMLWSGEVKLLQNDDTSTGHTIKGYKSHTGFSQGEAASMLRYSATRENGGIGIEHFGELVQDRANALGVQYDKSDANVGLDAVVNLLSGISRENPIANYIANQRIAEAKTIADAYYQQRENDCWNQYGMGYYEYEAMQEAIWDYADKVKTTIDEAEEFFFSRDADKMAEEKHNAELLNSDYFNTFAEEFKLAQDAYFKDLENEGSNDNDQSRAASSIGNSSEVQQGPRTDGLPGERVEGEEVQSRPESNVVGNINVPESSEVSGENAGELSGESEISKPGRTRRSFKSLLDGVNANPQNEVDPVQEKFDKEKASFVNTPGENAYAKALQESNNVREAVVKIVAPVAEYADGYKDWAGRQYKNNNTAIEVGGKYDDLDATTTSIGSVNERRRNARMAEFRRSAEERMEWVDTLLKRCGIPAEERSSYLPDGFKSFDELISDQVLKFQLNGKQTPEDAEKIVSYMKDSAEEMRIVEFNEENFNKEFSNGEVATPIGKVKIGKNQFSKIEKGDNGTRGTRFGMAAPTLERPDIILEKHSPKDGAERDTKYLFVKSFKKGNDRVYFFEHVTVSKEGNEVSVSSHDIEASKVKKELKENNLLWTRFSVKSDSSDKNQGLDNQQGMKSEPVENGLNPQSNLFNGKDTTLSSENQISNEKTSAIDDPGKKDDSEFPENSFESQNEEKIDELSGKIGDLDAEIEQLQDKLDGEENEMFRFNTEMAIESKTKRRNDMQAELDGLQQANDISRQEMKAPKKLEDRPVEAVIANKEKLQDFGEKIGMARKDTAKSGFKRGASDGIPSWKKKYKVHNADAKALSGVDKWSFSSWMNAQDMVLGEGPDKSKPFIAYTSESKKTALGNWERHYPVTDEHGKIIVFNSEEEFEATIPVYEAAQQKYKVRKGSDGQFKIVRAASNGKLVEYATFDTEEQAKAYLASPEGATSLLNHKRENYELPALENLTRNNMPDYRKGKDATPEMFLEDFGFRGGEFGNWLNAEERQQFLNLAYDAFMDLAEMLGVSPKAISLGGELSIAFGARGGSVRAGGGSAAAHYEPGRAVINLTKMHGAGSVAHEWAHALDNYFGLQGQGITRDRNNLDNTDVYSTTSYGGYKLRPEVREAFMNVVNAMTRKRVTRKVEADAQSEAYTKLQKNFNYAVEKSAKAELDTKRTSRKYNRKTKEYEYTEHTLTDEQKAKALELINKLPDDPTFKFTYSFAKNGFRASGDVAEELYELIADVLPNQSKAYGPLHNAFYYAEKLKDQKDRVSAAESGKEETVLTSTDYVKESSWFDRERASSYWTKTEELFARAMESWIADKMADQGKSSDYLTYKKGGVYEIMFKHNPYPTGEERTAINDAFQKLFDVIEEKVEDGKTLLHEPEAEYGVSEPTGTYTTSGGKKISYTQLDLFGEDTTVEAKPAKKTAAKRISTPDQIRLRPLAEGEMCNVERVYEENKYYDFTSKPTVSSPQDVAYIFKSLEDSAVEHAFVVLVKRGKPTVIHMGMGGLTEATVDHRLAMPAIKAMKPDKIYLVHNHPSGSLRPSAPDRKLLMSFRNAFGPKVQDGIIIDTFSGQFVTFDTYNDTNIIDEAERTEAEMPIKAYSMGKQIFKKGWVPQRVLGSNDIAEFISTQRLGVRDKICALILDNNLRVVGNIHLPYTSLLKDCDNIADEAGNVCAQMGGTLVALYGNNMSFDGAATIAYRLKKHNIRLVDAISVDSDFDPNDPRSKWVKDYKSAYDEGVMEPEPQYGASKDELYKQAVLNGDLDKAKRMLQQAAKDNGYDSDTDYQGSAAFNGAAPSENGYFATREERIEAFQNGEFEGEQSFGDYVEAGLDGWDLDWQINNPAAASHGNPSTLESIRNLSSVADNGKKTIKMYRAVPSDVKEDSFRNGDWVTPSRKYAEFHITLQDWEGGRIIEQEVPVDHIWWDGNDINEWGYDDGKQYAYQNTKNNKKLLDITYDQKGDLIPLSERFDQNNPDTLHEDEPEYGKHLAGVHNIYADKLRKAMKLGGLANPSTAVIDTNKNDFTSYGEISLVMPSSMVDAKTGRNAGTWTADAWTPVFPQIVKKIPAGGYDLLNEDMEVLDANGSRDIWSRTRNDLSNYLERDNSPYGLGFWYLTEKGLSPEVVRFDSGVSAEDKELYNKLTANDTKRAYELSKDEIKQLLGIYAKSRFNTIKGKPGTADEILSLYQELRTEWVKDLEDPNVKGFIKRHLRDSIEGVDTYGVPYSILSDFTYSMGNAIRKDGNVDVNATLGRAENKVKEAYDSDFLDWLDGKMQKYGVQEKFYAGMDKNGRAIYKPNTLESVSRYMKSQGRNGALDWSSVGNLIATVASRVRTLKQIRNASGNLVATEQEHKDFKEKWGDILFDIADECYRISSDPNAGFARLAEALREDNPALYLKKEYGVSLSTEARNNLSQFVDEVQNHFPTGYFETKFERPVMLDEFAAAVVPDNVADDIRAGLQDAGLKVITYEHGSEESRKAAMEEAYKEPNVRFRGENKPMFYSNAARAVDIVKQDKATPAQWLAMIQKNGGIKAGEDKWTGLSDWLANNTSKSLTKDEVLEYIRQNQIQVEDVNYSERGVRFEDDGRGTINLYQGEGWYGSIENDGDKYLVNIGSDSIGSFNSLDEAKSELAKMGIVEAEPINETRISYTTPRLENRREIALVVPSIEPWNKIDKIHFGDAGEGRAVAWVRFGEATAQNEADVRYEELKRQHEAEKDPGKAKEIAAEMRKLQFSSGRGEGQKVLVIDEIQSKRHQEGREKGYQDEEFKAEGRKLRAKITELEEEKIRLVEHILHRNNASAYWEDDSHGPVDPDLQLKAEEGKIGSTREMDRIKEINTEIDKIDNELDKRINRIPDAPFEKNWQELAMKRMLRYAAENGYDKIAWTTGEQQAERYNIGGVVEEIWCMSGGERLPDNQKEYNFQSFDNSHISGSLIVDVNTGEVVESDGQLSFVREGAHLSDVVGKELAERMIKSERGEKVDVQNVSIGGEGMKGFYDEILPRFMNKYGKKWGVSVNDVTLAIEGSPTMHSVDVTPEMRESVMEGQPLFREGNGQEPADGKMSDIKRETDKLSATFHTPVIFHPTLDDVPERWRAKKGVFVVDSGEIHLIGPNLTGVEDAHTTFIHEVTAHNGLRKMLGDENFNSLCDRVWNEAMSREDRDRYFINAYSKGRTLEDIQREAADEYMANLGESEVKPSLWKRIKAWIKSLFGKMGIKLKMTDEDIQYMLWKGRNRLMEGDNLEATIRKTAADSRKRRSMQERAANTKIKQDWKSLLQSIDLSSHAKNAPEITSGSKPVSGANLGKINNTAKLLDALSNEVSKKPLPKEDFINQIAGALGYNNSSVDISKYPKEEFVIGDGKSVTIRTSNHYANADNYTRTYNINGRDGNYGIVIKYRNARFNPNKNVDYLEFVYYGDRVENNKNLQLFIVDGLKHLIETGSVAKMPEIDRLNTSGRFRELIKSANGGDANIRSRTSEELDRTMPGWNDGSVREDGRDNTQITGTVSTYKKIGKWMQDNGMKGHTILDASSGLGLGTKALREMGFDVEDVEPFPSESREAPTYKSYDDITKKYDMVISNAVLNVIPDDWRNNVLHSMADKVKPGGKLFINVRDAGEIKGVKNKIELDSPHELLITNPDGSPRHYQRFWTKQELIDYVKGELGDGWKVEAATAKNSGVNNGRPVICTKLTGNGGPGERYRSDEPIINEQAIEALQMLYPEKTREQILDEHSELLAEYAMDPADVVGTPFKGGKGNKTTYQRGGGGFSVGKWIGGNLYVHKDYAEGKVKQLMEQAEQFLPEDFTYNTVMWNSAKPELIRFDESADFDTAREPVPGRQITINPSTGETVRDRVEKQIFHHKWEWVGNDYKGFDVQESYNWSRRFTTALEEEPSGWAGKWAQQLDKYGLEVNPNDVRFATGRPFKKKGESQESYLRRLQEWKDAVNKVVDENPDMKSMEQINDEIAALTLEKMKATGDTSAIDERIEELRKQLKEHGDNLDQEDKDRVEYIKNDEESLSDEEKAEKFTDNQELNIEKDVDAYTRRVFQEQMKENLVDTSDLGIRRTIKESIIERRSILEVSNYDDAVFFKDIERRTTEEQRKALPFILEGYPLDELPEDLKDRLERFKADLPSEREVVALLRMLSKDTAETVLVEGSMKDEFDKLEASLSNTVDSESAALEHGAISEREWFHNQRQGAKFSLDGLNPQTPEGTVIKNKYISIYTEHPEKLPETTGLLTNAVSKYYNDHLADLALIDYRDLKNMLMHMNPDTGGVEVTPGLKQVALDIREWFDAVYEMLKGAGFFDTDNGSVHLDNYVTHIWKFDAPSPEMMSKYEERLRTSSPYVKHRLISSLREGIEMGLEPKFDDIIKIMSQYGRYANEAVVNRGFINNLLGFSVNKMPVLMEKSKAISGYKEMPGATLEKYKVHPSAYRMLQAVFLPKETSDDVNLRGISGMFRVTSAFIKKMVLNASFFHHIALTESIIANTNPVYAMNILFNKVIMETAKTGKLPAYQDESVTRDAVAHLVKLGVTDDYNVNYINSTFEAFAKGFEFIDRKSIDALDKWIGDHPSAKRVPKALINEIFQPVIDFVRGVDVAQQGMDTLLWDMLHDAYKLWTYKYMADEIRGRKLSDKKQEERLLNSAGQWINDSFGGQHWEVIGMSPQFVRFLSKYLLSADWTVSAMFRQSFSMAGFGNLYNVAHPLGVVSDAFHAFKNGDSQFDQMRGINRWKQFCEEWKDWVQNAYLTEEAKFRLEKSYRNTLMGWITTFGFYGLVGALARFVDVQTQEKIAEERRAAGDKDYLSPYEILYPHGMKWYDYTFPGNTYGNKTYLFAGRYPDGTERYAREGKQYREIVEMFYGRDGFEVPGAFIDKMVGKLNPMWQLIVETGGGAMNSKFVNREIRDAKPGVERTMAILNNMVEGFVPWALVGEWNPLNHFMPNVKGMRPYRARTLMEEGLINKDLKLLEDVRRACIMNGLDTETIFKAAKQNVYLEYRKSLMDGVNDLQDALKQFDTEPDLGRKDRLGKYIDKQLGAEMHGQLGQVEFEHMIDEALGGRGTSKEDDESYLKYQTSEDRAEDIRFKKAMAGLKPIFDEWNSETGETKQSIYNNHKREIDSYNAFKNARGTMNYYKKNLKNGYGDPERAMQRIREERQKALRNAAKLK